MTLSINRVASRGDLRRFIGFPYRMYDARRHPNWVPPLRLAVSDALDERKNPFYREAARALFLAERGGEVVGRIAAIENRTHNRFHEDRVGFWGFFECVDDQAVADALFAAAEGWLAERGLTVMRGPMTPSTNYECGLLVDGFEHRPTFMTAWNPPYYDALCTRAGFAKAKDLLAFWFDGETTGYALPEFVARQAERALAGGTLTFRDMDPGRFDEEVAGLWATYNDAWERNWGFVPMSRAEFVHMAKDMKSLLDPRFAFVAEVGGEAVGFMLALPDYNEVLVRNRSGRILPLGGPLMLWGKRRIRNMRVMALGVRRAARSRSILALFTHEIMRRGKLYGKNGAEASWLLEDNQLIVKPMRAMGARERMRWRVYDRPVTPPVTRYIGAAASAPPTVPRSDA
ncbi:MAG: N-acetyltransferase [Gemmatimonadaceae bacterium]|nr:N-acetyltransferase [Gemmatimonadaceae bacterium]NUS46531.1 N-acetyltransferase [Gemmatimonadaceae bacterium]